ncbi:DUF1376 domain-containing protein [Klebsiella sp. R445]
MDSPHNPGNDLLRREGSSLSRCIAMPEEWLSCYLLLMFNYWQTGRAIPKSRLSKIARLSNDRWSSVESSLKEFFNDNGTEWVHERIERDLEMVRSSQRQKSDAGKASAKARKAKKSTTEQREGNDRSTGVDNPFEQDGNGNPTNKDPDIDTDLKENPLSTRERNSRCSGAAISRRHGYPHR